MRWRFRAYPGIDVWARDLAARENACCAFLQTAITVEGDEVIWNTTTIDDPTALQVLELMYELPKLSGVSVDAMFERFEATGVPIVVSDDGNVMRPAAPSEIQGGIAGRR